MTVWQLLCNLMEFLIRSGMTVMEYQDIFGQENILMMTTSANVGLIEIVLIQIKHVIVTLLNSNNYLTMVPKYNLS